MGENASSIRLVPRAAALLFRSHVWRLSIGARRRKAQGRVDEALRDLGRRALDVEFSAAEVSTLQATAREAFRKADERRTAISEIEGAAMPDSPEARAKEEQERRAKTAGLRAGLGALEADSDRTLVELGGRVLGLETLDPRLQPAVERCREAKAAATRIEEARKGDLAAWQGLPSLARTLGGVVHAAVAAVAVLLLWGILGGAGDEAPVRPRPPAPPVREETSSASAPTTTTAPTTTVTPRTTPRLEETRPSGETDKPKETTPPADPPITFSEFINSTGEKHVHPLTVAPEIAPVPIDPKAHHVGEQEIADWLVPKGEGKLVRMTFRLDRVPRGICELRFDLLDVDYDQGNTLSLNGQLVAVLVPQHKREFVEVAHRVLPSMLREGENEVVFETAVGEGSRPDDYSIRSTRLVPGPVLYRVSLTKVPGVDTRLVVLREETEIQRVDDSVVGEEVFPNISLSAGDYKVEVSGDGKNTDVRYVLEVQRLRPAGPGDEVQPNGDPETATPILLDQSMEGFLGSAGDIDCYRFTQTAEGFISLSLGAVPGVDAQVTVKDSRGSQEIVEVNTGGAGEPEEAEQVKLAAGQYVLVVSARADSPAKANTHAPYRLGVRRASAQAGFEEEPNNQEHQAQLVPIGKSLRGRLDPTEDVDWYRVHLDQPGLLKITVSGMGGVAYSVRLRGVWGDPPLGRTGGDAVITNWPVDAGDPAFAISGKAARAVDRKQTYRVRVDLLTEPEDGGAVRNNAFETAATVTPEDTLRSALYPWENEDWYRLTLEEKDVVYRFRPVQLALSRLSIEIYDDQRKRLKLVQGTPLENWSPPPGAYYLRVYRSQGGNQTEEYAFRVQEERVWSAEEERELNDERVQASPLAAETLVAAQLSPMGHGCVDVDWYRIEAGAAGKVYAIEVEHESKQLDIGVTLTDAEGKEVLPTVNQEGPGKGERIENWAPEPGTYFVAVYCAAEHPRNTPYTIRWRETGQLSADREFEPNNSVAEANDLALDLVVQGRSASESDVDVFRISTEKAERQVMRIRVTGVKDSHYVSVLGADGRPIGVDGWMRDPDLEIPGFALSKGEAVFVSVRAARYRPGEADFSIVATEVGAWADGMEAEPNHEWDRAGSLVPGVETKGLIAPVDDMDLFAWDVASPEDAYYTLSIRPPEAYRLGVWVYFTENRKDWAELVSVWRDGERGEELVIANIRPRVGRYGIRLQGYGRSAKPYSVRLERQGGLMAGRDVEFNAPVQFAQALVVGSSVAGETCHPEDVDWYALPPARDKALRLRVRGKGETALGVGLWKRGEKDWFEIRGIGVQRDEELVVEPWVVGEGEYRLSVQGRYTARPEYDLELTEGEAADGKDVEPNDRGEVAAVLVRGKEVQGRIGDREDRDVFRLEVPDDPSGLHTLTVSGFEKGSSYISWGVVEPERSFRWLCNDLHVPEGKTLELPDLVLEKGTWFFQVRGNNCTGSYRFRIATGGGIEAARMYECGHHEYRPREAPLDQVLAGRFLPWGNRDTDGVRFTLAEDASITAEVVPPKDARVWTGIWDEKGQHLRGEEGPWLYVPRLGAGRYLFDVTADCPEAVDYTLRIAKGPPGWIAFERGQDQRLDVAYQHFGGRIVRCTSEYSDDWGPRHLIDGGTQSNGWSAKDGALPQEIVIAFAGDRAAKIAAIQVNPRAADNPANWAKTAEVLLSTDGQAWESAGKLELDQEDRYWNLDVGGKEAKQVMVRVLEHHGGSYAQLGEVKVVEAVPGHESIVRADRAIPVWASDFAGGVNPLFSALGGKVESCTSEYDGNWTAANLLDGTLGTNGWCSKEGAAPHEIVFSLPGDGAEIDRVIFSPRIREDWHSAVRELEVSVSTQAKDAGFRPVARFLTDPTEPWQTFTFPPSRAQWVKVRVLANHGGRYFGLGEFMVIRR